MNDVEKKFGESLRHHEVLPPPAVWDQLSANLAQKRKRKAVAYWRIAAAVALLLLGTGTLIMLLRSESAVKTISQQKQPPASDPKESTAALAERTKEPNPSHGETSSGNASEASAAVASSAPVAKKDKSLPEEHSPTSASLSQLPDSPPQLPDVLPTPQPERPPVAALPPTAPEVAGKMMPPAAVHKIPSSTEAALNKPTVQALALSDSLPATTGAQRRTITVIYKPGNRLPKTPLSDQNGGLLSKTLSFLEDVKKNGPTYSELRSAKSALIDNVFSRDPDKQQ